MERFMIEREQALNNTNDSTCSSSLKQDNKQEINENTQSLEKNIEIKVL